MFKLQRSNSKSSAEEAVETTEAEKGRCSSGFESAMVEQQEQCRGGDWRAVQQKLADAGQEFELQSLNSKSSTEEVVERAAAETGRCSSGVRAPQFEQKEWCRESGGGTRAETTDAVDAAKLQGLNGEKSAEEVANGTEAEKGRCRCRIEPTEVVQEEWCRGGVDCTGKGSCR